MLLYICNFKKYDFSNTYLNIFTDVHFLTDWVTKNLSSVRRQQIKVIYPQILKFLGLCVLTLERQIGISDSLDQIKLYLALESADFFALKELGLISVWRYSCRLSCRWFYGAPMYIFYLTIFDCIEDYGVRIKCFSIKFSFDFFTIC